MCGAHVHALTSLSFLFSATYFPSLSLRHMLSLPSFFLCYVLHENVRNFWFYTHIFGIQAGTLWFLVHVFMKHLYVFRMSIKSRYKYSRRSTSGTTVRFTTLYAHGMLQSFWVSCWLLFLTWNTPIMPLRAAEPKTRDLMSPTRTLASACSVHETKPSTTNLRTRMLL